MRLRVTLFIEYRATKFGLSGATIESRHYYGVMWRNSEYHAIKVDRMARQVPEEELEADVEAVAKQGAPASIDDIVASLHMDMPHRTLQRRVAVLVEQGRLLRGSGQSQPLSFAANQGQGN